MSAVTAWNICFTAMIQYTDGHLQYPPWCRWVRSRDLKRKTFQIFIFHRWIPVIRMSFVICGKLFISYRDIKNLYSKFQRCCLLSFFKWHMPVDYEGVSKSFRTGRLEQELQVVQLSATRYSCIAILWVSLVSFASITLCIASRMVIVVVVVVVYFVIDSVRKLLDTPS
jgi:hypothetical protein